MRKHFQQDADILFLPSQTSTKRSQRERELAQASARSHVAKLHHRKRHVVDTSSQKRNPSSESTEEIRRSRIDGFSNSLYNTIEFDTEDQSSAVTWPTPHLSSSLCRQPSVWRTVSEELADPSALNMWEYSSAVVWPGYNPSKDNITVHWNLSPSGSTQDAGFQQAFFHACMWHSIVHHSIKSRAIITTRQSIQHHFKALTFIFEALKQPAATIPEAILFIIVKLIITLPTSFEDDRNTKKLNVPFPDLQWLSVVSLSPFSEYHMNALYRIVDLNGGIDQLRMPPAVASALGLDIVHSTFQIKPPHFPLPLYIQRHGNRDELFGYRQMFRTLGIDLDRHQSDTEAVQELLRHDLSNNVYQVLKDLRTWTKVLQRLGGDLLMKTDSQLLTIRRNLIQHRLLSTLPSTTNATITPLEGETVDQVITNRDPESTVTQVVRTSLFIFATSVTYPISSPQFHATLATRMQELLAEHILKLLDHKLYRLLIWGCMLGALTAVQGSHNICKSHFINLLVQVEYMRQQHQRQHELQRRYEAQYQHGYKIKSEQKPINLIPQHEQAVPAPSSWQQVRDDCLAPFVWYEEACDVVLEEVWTEALMTLTIDESYLNDFVFDIFLIIDFVRLKKWGWNHPTIGRSSEQA